MKKYLKICTFILLLSIIIYNFGYIPRNNLNAYKNNKNIEQVSRVNQKDIEIYKNGKWEKTFLKGVNIGTTKPGYFPGEFGITKEEYLDWFKQIKKMNANVIRVYTLQMPSFYEALYEFNKHTVEPLYVMHGVWIDEETMKEEMDAYSPKVIDVFKKEIAQVIDVLHGNAKVNKVAGRGYGEYKKDVSHYVIGYILGIEWDSYFVEATNDKHKGMEDFDGKWLYTKDAKPMEIFLANVGDSVINHETKTYNTQKPITFANWLTTDVIEHKNDIDEANTIGDIDEKKIKSKDNFEGGLFVSYHVYPYYPDFLNYETKYSEYVDEKGNKNSYKAYLKDLISHYDDRPVVVSEFGIPTSRGITHEDLTRGYNQGMVDETSQGNMNKDMLEDIHSTGYAGAIVFSWQDEWFKRTWNTMDIDEADSRPYWLDKMTNEQMFGLLSFDPGNGRSVSYNDGNTKEWKKKHIISSGDNVKLYMKSDEEYVYFRVNKKKLNLEKEDIIIPIDITPKSGTNKIDGYDLKLNKDADFLITISKNNKATIKVNEYYDVNDYLFNYKLKDNKQSDKFNIVKQTILGKSEMPETKTIIENKEIEVGNLISGNGNPKSKDYNSLSDYIVDGDDIEIRIPWLMLNVSNPRDKMIIDDFNENKEIKHMKINSIYAGAYVLENNKLKDSAKMEPFSWAKWNMPVYHERLKKSYYILKEAFKNID